VVEAIGEGMTVRKNEAVAGAAWSTAGGAGGPVMKIPDAMVSTRRRRW
jgi:hypothetical protein